MAFSQWRLVPKHGIEGGGVALTIGMTRTDTRAALKASCGAPKSHFPNEDDFRWPDGTWLRLRFDGDTLQDIEFLNGDLRLDGLPLHDGAAWDSLEGELGAKGFTFHDAQQLGDGQECTELGVNIATHEDVGGDSDGIEWVILSRNIA